MPFSYDLRTGIFEFGATAENDLTSDVRSSVSHMTENRSCLGRHLPDWEVAALHSSIERERTDLPEGV